MPSCPNGHQQELGLKCTTCGSPISYREALKGLLTLPKVEPDFGETASLCVGFPSTRDSGYSLALASGDSPKRTKDEFVVEKIQGGTWRDFYARNSADLGRWLKVVAFGQSQFRSLLVDTTDPLSVLAVASLPPLDRTMVIAITGDEGSTSMEQNTSYVALSLAMKRGLRVLALPQSLIRQTLSVGGNGGGPALTDVLSITVKGLLSQRDGLMDLLESDLNVGVRFHLLSPITSGSKQIYGTISNAFLASSYQLPPGAELEDVKTFHALVSCGADLREEFEEGLSQFRSRRLKSILNAECRFQDRADTSSFDLFAIYGTSESSALRPSLEGYTAVAKRAPLLKVESAI